MGKMADCGNDVWIGDLQACNECYGDFDLIIHLWRPEGFDTATCAIVQGAKTPGLCVKYWEYDTIKNGDTPIDVIAEYCRRPGRLLVHCAGGQIRSGTIAILALIARGVHPREAIARVWAAVATYGHFLNNRGLRDILEYRGIAE